MHMLLKINIGIAKSILELLKKYLFIHKNSLKNIYNHRHMSMI